MDSLKHPQVRKFLWKKYFEEPCLQSIAAIFNEIFCVGQMGLVNFIEEIVLNQHNGYKSVLNSEPDQTNKCCMIFSAVGWMAWERFRCNVDCVNDPHNCIRYQLFDLKNF